MILPDVQGFAFNFRKGFADLTEDCVGVGYGLTVILRLSQYDRTASDMALTLEDNSQHSLDLEHGLEFATDSLGWSRR